MQHNFSVPVPIDVAWKALLDPERVAPCMPGATLTSAGGNEFAGSVKVKLGPVSLLYKGTGSFTEIDEAGRRVVIDASGKDSRGNGTASATVTVVLSPQGDATSVQVDTDLKVTGRPAQLGRGMISEVGGKILNQFAERLATKLIGEEAVPEAPAPPAAEPAVAAAGAELPNRQRRPGWRVTPPDEKGMTWSTTAQQRPADKADAVVEGKPMPSDEAIDLLGTAGVPVLKRIAPIAAAIALVFVLFRLRRRKRSSKR